MPTCPLVPKDVHASVSSRGDGFDVDVKSWDEASAREVLRRARALRERRVFIESEQDFLRKVARAVEAIRCEVPPCCRTHPIQDLGEAPAGHACRAHVGS
jgi:hypothetical protein